MLAKQATIKQALISHPELWRFPWRQFCVRSLAQKGRPFIRSLCPVVIDPDMGRLDDAGFRATSVSVDDGCANIVEELSKPGPFRQVIDTHLRQFKSKVRKEEIRSTIQPLLRDLLTSVDANSDLATISTHEIYSGIADIIACELFSIIDRKHPLSEDEKLNHLLMINYLRLWELPADKFAANIRMLSASASGIRGQLIGISETVSSEPIPDMPTLPLRQRATVTFRDELMQQSDILLSLQQESAAILNGRGFIHRDLSLTAPPDAATARAALRLNMSQDSIVRERDRAYLQYEYYALLFCAVIATEFLLRTHAQPATADGDVLRIVKAMEKTLGADLTNALVMVFSTDGLNLRNRILHGGFFDIEARRMELILGSGCLASLGTPILQLKRRDLLIENVAFHMVQLATDVSRQFEGSPVSLTWTDRFQLTTREQQFAQQLHCDLLESKATAKAWFEQLSEFLLREVPCMSLPIKLGLLGWFKKTGGVQLLSNSVFLLLLLEPLLRMTLQRKGARVLQDGGKTTVDGKQAYRFKYQMMDDRGLLSTANLSLLTASMARKEAEVAQETLVLAAKSRNALAHGAMLSFTDDVRIAQGHLAIKSIQLLADASRSC